MHIPPETHIFNKHNLILLMHSKKISENVMHKETLNNNKKINNFCMYVPHYCCLVKCVSQIQLLDSKGICR